MKSKDTISKHTNSSVWEQGRGTTSMLFQKQTHKKAHMFWYFKTRCLCCQKYVSTEEEVDDSKKTFFILIAVTIAEALLIVVIVFVSMVTKNK